jgi:hypothetical protein
MSELTNASPDETRREAWREGLIQTVRDALIDVWNPQDDEGRDLASDASRVAVGALLCYHPDLSLAALPAAAQEPTCACGRPVSDPVHDGDWAQVVADLREENARLRTALGARPAPVVSAQWGVECDDDGDVSEAEDRDDAERIKAHHDRNCSHGHAIVRRVVTDWTTVADEGRAGA